MKYLTVNLTSLKFIQDSVYFKELIRKERLFFHRMVADFYSHLNKKITLREVSVK